jgi:methylmalonyl-CoA/ethylmalonyl-CoA epimerase
MFKGVDHVVVAVKDLDKAIENYEAIYNISADGRHKPPAAGIEVAYFRFEDSFLELVTNLDDQGPVAKRLRDTGEGVHLIAMKVDDIQATLTELRGKGIRLVGDPGAGEPVKGMVFIHPSATGGVLTQIVQR